MARFRSHLIGLLSLVLLVVAGNALAATGTLSCTVDPGDTITCTGGGWTQTDNGPATLPICLSTTDACGVPPIGCYAAMDCEVGALGDINSGCTSADMTDYPDDYYLYASEDSCVTSTAATENPLTIEAAESCGDNTINGDPLETCDGTDLNDETCATQGFDAGTLSCAVTCDAFVTSSCTYTCGNGSVDGTEACDDSNTATGDGCDASCAVESGWSCTDEPSVCTEDETPVVPDNVQAVYAFFAVVLPLALLLAFFLIAFVV